MRTILALFVLAVPILLPDAAIGSGFSFSEDFMVIAPDQQLSDTVLAKAEKYRRELAVRYLGMELPPGVGRALVRVRLSDSCPTGGFLRIDQSSRPLYRIRVSGPREELAAGALRHEVCHLVMEIQFGGELPRWADEGIAMFQDPDYLKLCRRAVLGDYAFNGNWPPIARILNLEHIDAQDHQSYAVASSLTTYLLTLGDALRFFKFAMAGRNGRWEKAARDYYSVSLAELESGWRKWATGTAGDNHHPRRVTSLAEKPLR